MYYGACMWCLRLISYRETLLIPRGKFLNPSLFTSIFTCSLLLLCLCWCFVVTHFEALHVKYPLFYSKLIFDSDNRLSLMTLLYSYIHSLFNHLWALFYFYLNDASDRKTPSNYSCEQIQTVEKNLPSLMLQWLRVNVAAETKPTANTPTAWRTHM